MSFSLNLTSLFASVTTSANDAATVAAKAQTYIVLAEQAGAALKLNGSQKLAMVQQLLIADLTAANPALAATVQKDWTAIAGVISGIIALFNFIGWAFNIVAPFIEAAAPGSVPAVTAIQAASAAAQAAEQAAQPKAA